MNARMDLADLKRFYQDGEAQLQSLFAEQRSNILLVAGDHYNKRSSRFLRMVNSSEQVTQKQKIRLTKNHIQRIIKTYTNNTLSYSGGVAIFPKNEAERADQKSAELNQAVWSDIKQRHRWQAKRRQYAKDYNELGEVWVKVWFDPTKGQKLGYEPVLDEMGLPTFDEKGEPVAKPIMTGDHCFERIHGFNVITDPDAKDWETSRGCCIRKMVPTPDLEARYKGQPEKLQAIKDTSDQTYKVFDTQTGAFNESKGLTMVKEFYFRPCADYPEGYYWYMIGDEVCEEGPLPLGLFPIFYEGFDEVSTSCRSHSLIKQLRPHQAEINRAASKMAEHQVTLGDDKVLLLNGTTMSPGGTVHGIKGVAVTGQQPIVMQGRTGEQYLGYMESNISDMYRVANLEEEDIEKGSQLDPYTMLFRSIKDKKKFAVYVSKFSDFEVQLCEFALRLAKAYYPDEMVVPAIGKNEFINIEEFRNTQDLNYQIRAEAVAEDLESAMGKQLTLNHIMQYAGQNLPPGDLGKIIRSMPYVNKELIFDDMTIDYDNANNDLLALDRGQWRGAHPHDNHDYMIKRLIHRMRQADFEQLPPEVQEMYQQRLDMHEQIKAQQVQEAERLKAGFIPTGGYLVTCDFYVKDALDPAKVKRVRVPYEALNWLLQTLEQQGTTQESLNQMDLSAQAGVAGQLPPPSQQAVSGQPDQAAINMQSAG